MKTLYLQLESGAAGDMLAAALLELVPDRDAALRRLDALGLPGIAFKAKTAERGGIAGTLLDVLVNGETEEPSPAPTHDHHDHAPCCAPPHPCGGDHHHHLDHEPCSAPPHQCGGDHHHHHHHHTSLAEVKARIAALPVPENVRSSAAAVYDLLAEAESRAHGRPVDQIHFHEVGSLDALADVTAVSLLLDELRPDRILASPPNAGGGTVQCAHGVLPVPAPATANLLLGMPWRGDAPEAGELLTPTGAALLKHFVSGFGPFPTMTVERIGIGLGHRDAPGRANLVRAFLGSSESPRPPARGNAPAGPNGHVAQLCANIDDMTGEELAFACERIRDAGALDVSVVPALMKKGRPGQLLMALARPEAADAVAAAILRETSTIGVRRTDCARYELERSFSTRPLECGGVPVRMKTSSGFGAKKTKPEFDDLARAATALNVPVAALRTAPQPPAPELPAKP